MLQPEEARAIDTVLNAVEEGLKAVEDNPHLNSHEAALNAGSPVTSLTNRFRINSAVVAALRVRLTEEKDDAVLIAPQGCTEEDANTMVTMYFNAFPGLRTNFFNAEVQAATSRIKANPKA